MLAVSFTVASLVMYSRLNPPAPVLDTEKTVKDQELATEEKKTTAGGKEYRNTKQR